MAYRIIDYNRRVYSKTKQKTMSKAISRNCVFSFQVRLNQPAAAHLADAQGTPVCRGTPVENHCLKEYWEIFTGGSMACNM